VPIPSRLTGGHWFSGYLKCRRVRPTNRHPTTYMVEAVPVKVFREVPRPLDGLRAIYPVTACIRGF